MQKKILIVDDDKGIQDVLKIALERAGFRTEAMLDGKPLLQQFPVGIDLVLLDVQMPMSDGLVICKYLKSKEETQPIPILMLSSVDDLGIRAKEAGADGFLQKPFSLKELLSLIEDFIPKYENYH